MKPRGEAEPDPDFGEAAGDLVGSHVDAHPERLQRVGSPGQRRRRPVAVFDHRDTRGRHHDRRHRGQVGRVGTVATGTHHVDGVVGNRFDRHRARVAEHDAG
ncbi:hypothetical protein MSHI_10800 [Mycobacterium shinjukuense]|uniref:Uncharacterized protein n=1 Tax=Mycobacterium shinjukuense TaxID=398694 RepID=A0A7I7MLM2_9MYCO|nr:hypothetical protein MSHI_10800 [Mycobacterium shinjukuense]